MCAGRVLESEAAIQLLQRSDLSILRHFLPVGDMKTGAEVQKCIKDYVKSVCETLRTYRQQLTNIYIYIFVLHTHTV